MNYMSDRLERLEYYDGVIVSFEQVGIEKKEIKGFLARIKN